jgi:hypothetical protein
MIRIGFVRWFITVVKRPMNFGMVEYEFKLISQGIRYGYLVSAWHGVNNSLEERIVEPQDFAVKRREDRYGLSPAKEAVLIDSLATEIASSAVHYSIGVGIVDFDDFGIPGAIHLVKTALVNAAATGESDVIERVPFIDLIADMRELRAERDRERLAQEAAFDQRREEAAAAEYEMNKKRKGAVAKSFKLLETMLKPSEMEEARAHGRITIKTIGGDFVIPTTSHGLVKHYVDGVYKVSYCVMFKDHTLPIGDEILMKVALIKTDPAKFIKTANKFVETARGGRRRYVA